MKGREGKGREEGRNKGRKEERKGGRKKGREEGIITGRIANTPETLINKGKQPFCCITLFI